MEGSKEYRTVLSIAGSDSIGGAGIQADIKTCTSIGTYAMTAITAVTAQNTMGVESYQAISPELLKMQLETVLADVRPDAVKIGMVPTVEHVCVIAEWLRRARMTRVVLDPVCVATSGDALAEDSVPKALKAKLMPLATVVTPNFHEAEVLCGCKLNAQNLDDEVFDLLDSTHTGAIIVKGGHMGGQMSTDLVYRQGYHSVKMLRSKRVDSVNTHGTGCTFSSALASYMALGCTLDRAAELAKEYIAHAITYGAQFKFGHGHGPVCHNFNLLCQED